MRSILLIPLVVRCLETIDLCIYVSFYVCCRDCVGICVNICCIAAVVENSDFILGVLKYVFCLYCEAWSCRYSYMGSVNVSSGKCCMLLFCVHPVAVPNAAFCMPCSLLMLVEDARSDHME